MNKYILLAYTCLILVNPSISAAKITAPSKKSDYLKLTSHSEMMQYLDALDKKCPFMNILLIGKSVNGLDIPALFFSDNEPFGSQDDKPVVLIYSQQHGNEPSGKEAALELAGELAAGGKKQFADYDLILVPMVNPDGAEAETRRNAADLDLNRDHAVLSQPETRALHDLFHEWMPEVTVDVHEYNAVSKKWVENGFIKNADEMIGGVTNLNIDPDIAAFSRDVFMSAVGDIIRGNGYTFHRYIVGSPFDDERMRYSTTAVNDGRQSMGIFNTFSFILEGKKYGGLLTHLKKRTLAQITALKAILSSVSENAGEIKRITANSRNKLLIPPDSGSGNPLVHLQMDYFPAKNSPEIRFPVFDLYEWIPAELKIDNFHPVVKVKKSVPKPVGYVFSEEQTELIEILNKHKIIMSKLAGKSDLRLEIYTVINLTEQVEEELTVPNVDVLSDYVVRRMDEGTVVVYLDQPAGNLIPILLEPQSTQNIAAGNSGQENKMTGWLQVGQEYPVYRLIENTELGLEPID